MASHCPRHDIAADLGSLVSVRSAATEIRDRLDGGDLPPSRGFVGNAGIQYTDALTEGPDGLESTFTVNVLANHLFVRLLQDRFAAPARIVITVSDTHFGDLKHNMGMAPGPVWQSPDVLARTRAFPGRTPRSPGAPRTRRASRPPSTSCTSTRAACRPGWTPSPTTRASYPAPASPATQTPSPGSRCGVSLPALALTPFATSRNTAGCCLADVVLGTTQGADRLLCRAVRSSFTGQHPT